MGTKAHLGDAALLVLFIWPGSASEVYPTIEPAALGLGKDAVASERSGDLCGSIGGVAEDGGFIGNGELESQKGFGQRGGGPYGFSGGILRSGGHDSWKMPSA